MAALTADRPTPRRSDAQPKYDQYPVAAGAQIYAGSLVTILNGHAQPAAAGDGGQFVAFARENVNNTTGADGDKSVDVEWGSSYLFNVAGGGQGRDTTETTVYASDDQTVTTADGAGANTAVGRIAYPNDANSAWIWIDGPTG